jgi:hypothetical protein
MELIGEEITEFARSFREQCLSLGLKECSVTKDMGTLYGMGWEITFSFGNKKTNGSDSL